MAKTTQVRTSLDNMDRLLTREETPKPLTLWQSVRKYPRIVGYCFGLTSAILLYGYDFVIVGTVSSMPYFQYNFGEALGDSYIIPSLWLALWTASSPLGALFGALATGAIQDQRGRRLSLALGSCLSAVGVAVCYVSDLPHGLDARRGAFLAGKFIQGIAIGGVMCTTQTYMSEVLPTALRGPILTFFPTFTLLGQLVGAIVVFVCLSVTGPASYRICFATQWPFSAVPIILAIFLPESPTWLLRQDRTEAAFEAQKRLDKPGTDTQANIEVLRLSLAAEREQGNVNETGYADCFKGVNLRRTLIVGFVNCLPQLFGLTLLASSSYFIQIVGLAAGLSVIFLILGIALGLVANIVSIWSVNTFGRRPLILSTLTITGMIWLAVGISGCFQSTVVAWYTSVSMMLVVITCGIGVWPVSYVVAAETSALNLRAKTSGIGWMVGGLSTTIFGLALPYIFSPDAGNLRAKTGFVYAGFCALGVIVTWMAVPEMKGRSNVEIDKMFALRLPTRSFKTWIGHETYVMKDGGEARHISEA